MPEAGLKTMGLFRESWIVSSDKHLSKHYCTSRADCPHLTLSSSDSLKALSFRAYLG